MRGSGCGRRTAVRRPARSGDDGVAHRRRPRLWEAAGVSAAGPASRVWVPGAGWFGPVRCARGADDGMLMTPAGGRYTVAAPGAGGPRPVCPWGQGGVGAGRTARRSPLGPVALPRLVLRARGAPCPGPPGPRSAVTMDPGPADDVVYLALTVVLAAALTLTLRLRDRLASPGPRPGRGRPAGGWSRSRAGSARCPAPSGGTGCTRRAPPPRRSRRRPSSATRPASTPGWAWATAVGRGAAPPGWASCRWRAGAARRPLLTSQRDRRSRVRAPRRGGARCPSAGAPPRGAGSARAPPACAVAARVVAPRATTSTAATPVGASGAPSPGAPAGDGDARRRTGGAPRPRSGGRASARGDAGGGAARRRVAAAGARPPAPRARWRWHAAHRAPTRSDPRSSTVPRARRAPPAARTERSRPPPVRDPLLAGPTPAGRGCDRRHCRGAGAAVRSTCSVDAGSEG